MYQGISCSGKTLYLGVTNETHCMRVFHVYTHTHTHLINLVNASESFTTAPNIAALWHRKPASARTSSDRCGAQHSDKKETHLCTSYTYENLIEFHYNIDEGIFFFKCCPSFSTLFFHISTIACTPIQQMNSVVSHHTHNGITGCLSRTKQVKI